jgi:DNA-binding LacI/PurR family transcriptional regulator
MNYSDFKPETSTPLNGQVIAWIESQIDCGALKPGDRIPSTDDLANKLGVGRKVIQQALAKFSKRGILERSPGRGTYLSGSFQSNRVAVIFPSHILISHVHGFFRLLCNALLKDLRERGYNVTLHIWEESDQQILKQDLSRQASEGRLLAIINHSNADLSTGNTLYIKDSMASAQAMPTRETILFRGLSYLFSRGYRNIAILNQGSISNPKRTHQCIADAIADHSTDLVVNTYCGSNSKSDQGGDKLINDILNNKDQQPDAIFSLDDNLSRSAIFAIACRGLRIPKDLAFLSHANAGSPILSPVELTRLENDPREYSKIQVDHLEAMLAGKSIEQHVPRARFVTGKSCGE